MAKHLVSMYSLRERDLTSDVFKARLTRDAYWLKKDFGLTRFDVLSRQGNIIYSTDSERIGSAIRADYFKEVVAAGKIHVKVKKGESNTGARPDRQMPVDVVETYVPIIRDGLFQGAFEIHYDISTQRKELNRLSKDSAIVLISFICGFLTIILVVLIRANKTFLQQRRAEDALRESHEGLERRIEARTAALEGSKQELHLLSNQLIMSQEKERERIARELHDGIGQSLSAIKYKMEDTFDRVSSGTADDETESWGILIFLVKSAIEEVRNISMELRPSTIDDLGIIATVGWFTREFNKIYQDIRIEREIHLTESDVPEHLKIVMFRVLQEALNNAAKHSMADTVTIVLTKKERSINMVIKDNGCGFEREAALAENRSGEGFGLKSMRERIELSGGSCTIESNVGTGTAVRARWPIKH